MRKFAIAVVPFAILSAGLVGVALAEPVTSGPQVGQKVPGPFKPLHVTGPDAGQRECLYCKNGANPVAMIFAREVSPELVALLKQIDAATAAHADCSMGSFVVFLSDLKELPDQLKKIAETDGIKTTILSVDEPAGPPSYKIAGDADVTVVLYTHRTVKVNRAFRKGELDDKAAAAVVTDLAKILPTE